MKKSVLTALILLALIGAGYGIWLATKPEIDTAATSGPGGRPKGPAQVRTVAVARESVPIFLDAVGTVEADQTVAVRSEVSGILQSIHFHEGDLVKAGQLLFQIDASTLQAEFEKARANLARDQATLAEARAQARRLAPLAQKEFVTRQEYAQAVAQEQAASATAGANQAGLKAAQIQLDRTRIRAPITGRAGILNTRRGNLVSANAQEPLVVINATQPVMVAFSVPQQALQDVRTQQRAGGLPVEIRREADDPILAQGTLAFIDNTVDPQTGTIKLKARIPNRNEAIWPGELVSTRLILGVQENALVIPEAAVQPGQQGQFVYLVDNGKARMQPIIVTRQVGTKVVISRSLKPGQQVIINAPQNLRPGAPVKLMGADSGGGGRSGKAARSGAHGKRPGPSTERASGASGDAP